MRRQPCTRLTPSAPLSNATDAEEPRAGRRSSRRLLPPTALGTLKGRSRFAEPPLFVQLASGTGRWAPEANIRRSPHAPLHRDKRRTSDGGAGDVGRKACMRRGRIPAPIEPPHLALAPRMAPARQAGDAAARSSCRSRRSDLAIGPESAPLPRFLRSRLRPDGFRRDAGQS